MALNIGELSDLEVSLLGVLSLGLPPSRAAADETFRIDHCTAVVAGLWESSDGAKYLREDGIGVAPDFAARLRLAVEDLIRKEILALQPGGMPAPPGGFEPGLAVDMVNPYLHPAVLNRWLGQQCLDALLGMKDVYGFLMSQYARAGEFWRTARETGYGR